MRKLAPVFADGFALNGGTGKLRNDLSGGDAGAGCVLHRAAQGSARVLGVESRGEQAADRVRVRKQFFMFRDNKRLDCGGSYYPEVVGWRRPDVNADRLPKRYDIRVFPVAPVVVVIAFILWVLAGMVIGALGGLLVSLATKCGQQGIIKDAFLGSFGFLVGFPRLRIYALA